MNKKLLLAPLACLFSQLLQAQIPNTEYPFIAECPKSEIRSVWLTTIGGLDWPHSYSQSGTSAAKQQKELCGILDKLAAAGINTVLFQTRIRATTAFDSDMEPWDGAFSGFPGKSPGYDVLAFAISECHRRGMKLHAWVVCIPAGKWNGTGCKALRRLHPKMIKKVGDEGFLNPESSETASYLANFCSDIASRYDVDGIHLDYIRYPDGWGIIKDKDAGRRNITRIVKAISESIKKKKSYIALSCSPVGKYADTKRQWSHGWNARDAVCQDAIEWLHTGYMDQLYPMMYFRDQNFYPFAVDWQERSNGKHIAPGLGIYFMHPREKNWPLEDISREFKVLRQLGLGNGMFRSKFFTDNTKGIYNFYADSYAASPATIPAMTWLSNTTNPVSPTDFSVSVQKGITTLKWNDSNNTYNIYGSDSYPVDTNTGNNLLAIDFNGNSISFPSSNFMRYYAVTAVDRYGKESEAAQMSDVEATLPHSIKSKLLLFYDGSKILLDNHPSLTTGQLVVIQSTTNVNIASTFITKDNNQRFVANVGALQPGHYKVYLCAGKKKTLFNIGWVQVPVK